MAETLDEPLGVVARDEVTDDPVRLLEARELMHVDALLLEGAYEALGDAVALGFANVRGRDRAPPPLHLVDPGVGDVLWTPVTPDRQASGHVFAKLAEGGADALANRLERRPAIAELRRVPADHFVEMMVDRAEEPAPALAFGVEAGRIGPPHHVGPLGDDRAVVRRVAIRRPAPPRGQPPVGPHQLQHTLAAHGQPAVGQARPDLPIAFPVERARGQDGAARRDDVGVAVACLRPRLIPRRRRARSTGRRVPARPRHPIHRTDHRQRIRSLRARTHAAFHRARLFPSSVKPLLSMRSSASSNLIISSPILARASVSSRSSGSPRIRSPVCPAPGRLASNSPARARALGSPARPRPRPPRAGDATRARSSVPRSSVPAARDSPLPAVHYPEESTSAACRACPASLVAVIVVIVETVSKEIGSDLRRDSACTARPAVASAPATFRVRVWQLTSR